MFGKMLALYAMGKDNELKSSASNLCSVSILKSQSQASLQCLFTSIMKAIIQRVSVAKVTVGEQLVSEIGQGLCVLVGICQSDTIKDVDFM